MAKLNLFIIPSWYPCNRAPVKGIFFQEQAIAFAEMRENWNVAISVWGQNEYHLPLRSIKTLIKSLGIYWQSKSGTNSLRERVREYVHPTVTWTPKILDGNLAGFLAATRYNLAAAIQDLGSIDLILAYVTFPAGVIANRLSQETGVPYIVSEVMGPYAPKSWENVNGSIKASHRNALSRASERIAISPFLSDCIARYGVELKPMVIPWMIDERFFTPMERSDQLKGTIFFSLANLVEAKGITELLRALKLVLERLPTDERADVTLRIGGEGLHQKLFKADSIKMGIDRNIVWLGRLTREQVLDEMRKCSYFVLPSRYETFSVACVEAMACGKAVIATRCGGPQHIISSETGMLTEVGDIQGLSANMMKVLTGEVSFSPNMIREYFLSRFSRETVVQQWEQVFEKVLRR